MVKKVFSVLLSFVISLSISSTSFAQNLLSPVESEILTLSYFPNKKVICIPVGEAKYIETHNGELIEISDLLSFETNEEANQFSENIELELSRPIKLNPSNLGSVINQITPMSTNYDVIVASRNVAIFGKINLRVAYATSGSSHTGIITYQKAYTTFTGFTFGFGWDERICYSYVTASGKDIYAYTSGTLDYYILVEGFIKYYSVPVTLSGYAYAVR